MFPTNAVMPVDERGLFLCQDPALRAQIMPLFSFDPRTPATRPHGHGTTFRIDPWGTCATAFHVIEDLLCVEDGAAVLRKDIRLAALQLEGLIYGRVAMPTDSWRPFDSLASICGIERRPLQDPLIRNVTELAALRISRSAVPQGELPYLPIDMYRWRPRVGERVMALGFADLDVDHNLEGGNRAIDQYMYGSEAEIVEVQPANGSSSRPWPVFRVEANWPGGMSGGPVFNQDGLAIGLVSTGMVGAGIGTVTYFSGWDFSKRSFNSLDTANPGWLRCWGGFNDRNQLIGIAQTRYELDAVAHGREIRDIRPVSVNPKTNDYVLR